MSKQQRRQDDYDIESQPMIDKFSADTVPKDLLDRASKAASDLRIVLANGYELIGWRGWLSVGCFTIAFFAIIAMWNAMWINGAILGYGTYFYNQFGLIGAVLAIVGVILSTITRDERLGYTFKLSLWGTVFLTLVGFAMLITFFTKGMYTFAECNYYAANPSATSWNSWSRNNQTTTITFDSSFQLCSQFSAGNNSVFNWVISMNIVASIFYFVGWVFLVMIAWRREALYALWLDASRIEAGIRYTLLGKYKTAQKYLSNKHLKKKSRHQEADDE